MALEQDTAIIGAKWDGSAYVFTRSDGEWTQQAKLDGGGSVALDGNTAVIGTVVYTGSDDKWTQQATLAVTGGSSVALDEDTAIIGAKRDDDPNGDNAGSAYVFTRSNESWSQQAKLTPNDGDNKDNFGESVALDGDTALVGARYDEDPNGEQAGSAYVFTRSAGEWMQQSKIAANDGDTSDAFGISVALNRNTALVGAWEDEDPNGDDAGSAYVFTGSDDK